MANLPFVNHKSGKIGSADVGRFFFFFLGKWSMINDALFPYRLNSTLLVRRVPIFIFFLSGLWCDA